MSSIYGNSVTIFGQGFTIFGTGGSSSPGLMRVGFDGGLLGKMSKRKITAGITSVSLPIFVSDTSSTTGTGLSGLVYNTSGLVAEYRRQGQSAWAAITLVAGTLGTYTSGGLVADGALAGSYEVCPPDAAFAAGARWVRIRLYGAANMLPVEMELELDAVNYQSSTAFIASVPAVVGAVGSISGVTLPATVPSLAQIQTALPTDTTIAADVQSALTSQGVTTTRAAKLDNLDAAITSRSTFAGGAVSGISGVTFPSVVPSTSQIASAILLNPANLLATDSSNRVTTSNPATGGSTVTEATIWAYGSRTLSAQSDSSGVTTLLANYTAARAAKLDNLDANITSRSTYAGGPVASVTGDVGGKVLGGGASSFVANGCQVSATVSGNVTVGAYATGKDPASMLKADADFAALLADTNGQFTFSVPSSFPGNGTLVLKDKAGVNTLLTITLGFDSNQNVISRTVA